MRRVAGRLGLAPQTLGDWEQSRAHRRLERRPRGRPRRTVARATRDRIVELVDETRGRLGVPALKRVFGDVPRTRLRRILVAYRRRHRRRPDHLVWTTPGTVWAADFTEPSTPVDGRYRYVLSVRDLASGCQLLALPATHATASVTDDALQALMANCGPPLVLKTDNGSHFTDRLVTRTLRRFDVAHLRSPPATPTYNGSVEAGIGSLQTRLHQIASLNGRPASPTCDDLELARREANEHATPLGPNGPSPDERWRRRTRVTVEQRRAFGNAIAAIAEIETQRLRLRRVNEFTPNDHATLARRTIRRALVESGYLFITRSTANSSTQLDKDLSGN